MSRASAGQVSKLKVVADFSKPEDGVSVLRGETLYLFDGSGKAWWTVGRSPTKDDDNYFHVPATTVQIVTHDDDQPTAAPSATPKKPERKPELRGDRPSFNTEQAKQRIERVLTRFSSDPPPPPPPAIAPKPNPSNEGSKKGPNPGTVSKLKEKLLLPPPHFTKPDPITKPKRLSYEEDYDKYIVAKEKLNAASVAGPSTPKVSEAAKTNGNENQRKSLLGKYQDGELDEQQLTLELSKLGKDDIIKSVLEFYKITADKDRFSFESVDSLDETLKPDAVPKSQMSPYPRAIDMARNNDKSLWRDIEGVQLQNGFANLSSAEADFQEKKFELMKSEGTYLHQLRLLEGHYMRNIEKYVDQHELISRKDYECMFRYIPEVIACSTAFLKALDEDWQRNYMLVGFPDIIKKFADGTKGEQSFQSYVLYHRRYHEGIDHMNALKGKSLPFAELLTLLFDRSDKSSPHFSTLEGLLVLPMNRVTRLPLLLSEILKTLKKIPNSDELQTRWRQAYDAVRKLAQSCDNEVNRIPEAGKLMKFYEELDFYPESRRIPIVATSRQILIRSDVVCSESNDRLQLVLMTDLILIIARDNKKYVKTDYSKVWSVVDFCAVDSSMVLKGYQPTEIILTMFENCDKRKVQKAYTFVNENDCKLWREAWSTLATASS